MIEVVYEQISPSEERKAISCSYLSPSEQKVHKLTFLALIETNSLTVNRTELPVGTAPYGSLYSKSLEEKFIKINNSIPVKNKDRPFSIEKAYQANSIEEGFNKEFISLY